MEASNKLAMEIGDNVSNKTGNLGGQKKSDKDDVSHETEPKKGIMEEVRSHNICDNELGNGVENVSGDGMVVSHTESGYLTDSVSHTKKESTGTSVGSSGSDSVVTPCAEDLITFSNSSSNVTSSVTTPDSHDWDSSPNSDQASSDTDQASGDFDHADRVNKIFEECTDIINQTSRIEQLDSLARMNLDCDRKNVSNIDDIFATNCFNGRPDSLSFNQEVFASITDKIHGNVEKSDSRKRSKSSAFPIPRQKEGVHISEEMLSKSLPHGKIVKSDSGLIEFIADDLQEKIRRSSPLSKTASSNVSSRRSSQLSLTSVDSMASSSMATSMTSGMSRSYPQSPDGIPPIDPMAVHEIENQARLVADSLDLMMGNLRNNLHQMSAISVGCEEAYKTSVDVTCDSVDASIKAMYALMAKCEELSKTMEPVYRLADQIKEIKRLLDRFESQIAEKP